MRRLLIIFGVALAFFRTAVPLYSADQIMVQATVKNSPQDLSVNLESDHSDLSQNQELTLTLRYASNLSYPSDFTLEANWSQGTIEGDPVPSVDLIDYISQSATDAFNQSPPIIDLLNRRITWQIKSFPGNSDQSVSFRLKTNSNYLGPAKVTFGVKAKAIINTVETEPATIKGTYKYIITNSNSSSSSTTSFTSSAPSVSKSSSVRNLILNFNTLTANTTKIDLTQTGLNRYQLRYGTAPNNLSNSFTVISDSSSQEINLSNLNPDTAYYLQIVAKDFPSDLYYFHTARPSTLPEITENTIEINSGGNPLLPSDTLEKTAIIPTNSLFEVDFGLPRDLVVKEVKVLVRNRSASDPQIIEGTDQSSSPILGASVFANENTNTIINNASEVSPGHYSTRLKSLPFPGLYEVYILISDFNGNVVQRKLFDLRIVEHLRVLDQSTGKPLEKVSLLLSLLNRNTNLYETISPQTLSIANPSFSNSYGFYDLVLPAGKYRAQFTSLNHENYNLDFEISSNSNPEYPAIYLKPTPKSLKTRFDFYKRETIGLRDSLVSLLKEMGQSNALFIYISQLLILAFVIISLLSFSSRTKLPLAQLFRWPLRHLISSFSSSPRYSKGAVFDENKHPLEGVEIVALSNSGQVLEKTFTNKNGRFYLTNYPHLKTLEVLKKNYLKDSFPYQLDQNIVIKLKEKNLNQPNLFIKLLVESFGLLFEFFLFFSFVLEIVFTDTFGLTATLPFILLSLLNLIAWGAYYHQLIWSND